MTRVWEETGSALSTRLLGKGGPALLVWVWAFIAWSIPRGGWTRMKDILTPLIGGESVAGVAGVVVAVLVGVTASQLLVARLTLPVLRLLEGYWPPVMNRIRDKRVTRWRTTIEDIHTMKGRSSSGPPTKAETAAAAVRLRAFPTDADDVMPTRVGNIIRAGERRPATWYGLDAVVVWPQLWLVLPEQARADITAARAGLDTTVNALVWAVLSCALGLVWAPAALVGALVAVLAWRWWIPAAASAYATLISAVFDTHRFLLYDALCHPRPGTPAEEPRLGQALTKSVLGSPGEAPTRYAHPGTDPTRT